MELQELIDHFFSLYGRRNRLFLQSLIERIDLLNNGVGDLQDAIRKEMDTYWLGIALARVVSRVFCVAEYFAGKYTPGLPLVEIMVRKYPLEGCSYCLQFPCQCAEQRPKAKLKKEAPQKQLRWSLPQWSRHLDQLYGARNKEKGIEYIISRLFKEVDEGSRIGKIVRKLKDGLEETSTNHDKIEEEFALELADILAWTIATALFFNINLERVVLDRFGQVCWNCKQKPCRCMNINIEPVNWVALSRQRKKKQEIHA